MRKQQERTDTRGENSAKWQETKIRPCSAYPTLENKKTILRVCNLYKGMSKRKMPTSRDRLAYRTACEKNESVAPHRPTRYMVKGILLQGSRSVQSQNIKTIH